MGFSPGGYFSANYVAGDRKAIAQTWVWRPPAKVGVLTAVALAIPVLICLLSYRPFEGPLMRMAHQKFRFEGASRTAAQSQPTAA
jgi:hypothetical protein